MKVKAFNNKWWKNDMAPILFEIFLKINQYDICEQLEDYSLKKSDNGMNDGGIKKSIEA